MVETISSYTPSDLQFVSSKLFFQGQDDFLQKIGFVSIASNDIFYKYTFQQVQPYYFMQGCEFEGYTVEHKIYEQGIIYKLGFLNPKYQNVQCLSVNLCNTEDRVKSSTLSIFKSYPWLERVLLLLVLGFLPYGLAKGLFWINVSAITIFVLFSIWKIVGVCYNYMFKTKKSEYGGFSVNYQVPSDTLFLSPDVITTLKKLPELQITKFCYSGNCMYFFQDIHVTKEQCTETQNLKLSYKLYSEPEKAELQQRTLAYLQHPDFISQFSRH